jgi:PAS domain S-box-containing protein
VNEELLRQVVAQSPDVIVVTDASGAITFASAACRSVLGWDPDGLAGKRADDVLHPEDVTHAATSWMRALESRSSRSVVRYRRRDGTYVWVESNARVARDAATRTAIGTVAVVREITQRWLEEAVLLDSEDAALYKAKADGRDRVARFHEVPAPDSTLT